MTRARSSPFIGTVAHFGWLDGDDAHRSAMLEVVKLFEDSSTVDELGIGSVRDTFSRRRMRTVGAYRLVIGQPLQEDQRYLGDEAEDYSDLLIDLSPSVAR